MIERQNYHEPVLFNEVMDALAVRPGGVYADGTLGGGGHSAGILARLNGRGFLYGIDRDDDAIQAALERLKNAPNLGAVFEAVHGNFHELPTLLATRGVTQLDGVLLDLGVSSHQLDTPERGFSYHDDAPLDMRMDTSRGETAANLLARLDERALIKIFREYGEERWADRIAKIILERRGVADILTTHDLVACVDAAIPKAVRMRESGHPARRVFQAMRIAVNDELEPLETTLESILDMLKPGGRLCVITFHSLEDRIVKQTFARLRKPCTCPPSFPVCVCGKATSVSGFATHPILPTAEELERNTRSHSAKLRVAEKL